MWGAGGCGLTGFALDLLCDPLGEGFAGVLTS